MAATVATKVAIVAVATVTLAGAGNAVRDAVTAPDRARPAAAARATAANRPPATAPSLRAAASDVRRGAGGPRQRPLARERGSARGEGIAPRGAGQGGAGARRARRPDRTRAR